MPTGGQGKKFVWKQVHRDTFGQLGTALSGVTRWTDRQIRNTGIVKPHIAKNDIFSYTAQFNHDKELQTAIDDFHIHMIPIGLPVNGQVIAIDYAIGVFTNGNIIPNTLPITGTALITVNATDHYKYMIKSILSNIDAPILEGYSGEIWVKCQRRNDAQDTYSGEFALIDGDSHYISNSGGSFNTITY